MPEKYIPSEAELGLAQEHLESLDITEQKGMRVDANGETRTYRSQIDSTGREILRNEVGTDDAAQVEYQMGEGEKAGQEWKREYSNIVTNQELVGFEGTFPLKVVRVGETVDTKGEATKEPWAHFEITDKEALSSLVGTPAVSGENAGGSYQRFKGSFLNGTELAYAGRSIKIADAK